MRKQVINIQKVILFAFILAAFNPRHGECASTYYAYSVYEYENANGKKINMNVVSKTSDERTCRATANSNPKQQGAWMLLGTDCVTGSKYDQNFVAVFNNQPTKSVYLSYANLDGLETRINFVGVTGDDSPVPGFPIDIPPAQIMPLINNMKQSLEAVGIKNVRVIVPPQR